MKVIKRDGRVVDFNEQKIIDAILAAFNDVDGEITPYAQEKAENIAYYIEGYMEDETMLSIEEIQDLVEEYLMASERKDVAKAYIRYRYKREIARSYGNELTEALKEKLQAKLLLQVHVYEQMPRPLRSRMAAGYKHPYRRC